MLGLFDFEQDGRYPLRRIPMIMRFNLDACGIKISLNAWITLSRSEREQLLVLPCTSDAEKSAYREKLTAMLALHADSPDAVMEFFKPEAAAGWRNDLALPAPMVKTLSELAVPVPTLEQWAELGYLQRFALLKLSRPGHKNENLLSALKEFGLG